MKLQGKNSMKYKKALMAGLFGMNYIFFSIYRQFGTFGSDPREEIMVLERVLLQTIKFDLQVEHPYDSIIRFAKSLKGKKNLLF